MKKKQGFPDDCKWSHKKWEKCVKKLKGKVDNPYAVCNSQCPRK